MKNSIIIIILWFGNLPEHFPIFLNTISYNSTIDFLMITDIDDIKEIPSNLTIVKMTFEEIKNKVQKFFDFEIVLDRPYKLCDYRPIWGLLFAKFVYNYDFWGYCDLDMLFGDLRKFLSDEVLNTYDKIYELGHLTLYKNNNENNERYKLAGGVNYKDAFTTSRSIAFDEIAGMQNKFDFNNIPTYRSRDYADITWGKVKFYLSDFRLSEDQRKHNNYEKQLFYYEDGHVYRAHMVGKEICVEEFNYIHFSKRKMFLNGISTDQNAFYITNKGLFEKNGFIEEADFDRYNSSRRIEEEIRRVQVKHNHFKEIKSYYWELFIKKCVSFINNVLGI